MFVYRLLHARIDAGQDHRLIVPLGRKREVWSDGQGRTTYRNGPYKEPAIEFAIQKIAATRAGSLTSNHLQTCHCPSLGGGLTQIELCGSMSFHAHTTHVQPDENASRCYGAPTSQM